MRILAFDCSLTSTGFCTPTGDLDTLVPPKGARGSERLAWIDRSFQLLIAAHQPTIVIAEAPFTHGPNATGSLNLHKLYGCLETQCWEHLRADPVYIPPATLKLAATGSGQATKGDMERAALALGYTPANSDEADAALLWHGAMNGWFDERPRFDAQAARDAAAETAYPTNRGAHDSAS